MKIDTKSIQALRGMQDIYGKDYEILEHIISVSVESAKKYGYKGIETPVLESSDVFKRAVGETSDIVSKEMYTFLDRNSQNVTLRPEGTAPITRAVVSNGLYQGNFLKFFSYGPMFRYERPQKGRYRQFHQFSIEAMGLENPACDIEVISLALDILKNLNIKGSLQINTLGDFESRNLYAEAIKSYFYKYKSDLSEESKIRLEKNPLRILDSKDINDKKISLDAPKIQNFLNQESKVFFEKVLNGLNFLGVTYNLNDGLVRGLDYYCHTIFEITSDQLGSQDAILGGGRYNGLSQQLGSKIAIPSIGWATGIERLMLILEKTYKKQPMNKKIGLVCIGDDMFNHAMSIAITLRCLGLCVVMSYKFDNIGKSIKYLSSNEDCDFAVFIGLQELSEGKVKVKNLKLGQEVSDKEVKVSISDLGEFFSEK
jgi:histidyl-tRNA synthetase